MGEALPLKKRARAESFLTKMMEEALDAFHRRLVVIFGGGVEEILPS